MPQLQAGSVLLLLTVSAAPWLFAGATADSQVIIAAGLFLSAVLSIRSLLRGAEDDAETGSQVPIQWQTPGIMVPLLALVAFALIQLTWFPGPRQDFQNAVLRDALDAPIASTVDRVAYSLCPNGTLFDATWLAAGAVGVFLGAALFRTQASRRILLGAAAANGVLLAVFGVVQKLSWNGQLFWTVPLTHGGQPFASFVNRNNAANFLSISAICCIALITSSSSRSRANSSNSSETITPPGNQLLSLLALGVILAGVLASASRGGAIALFSALVVVSFVARRRLTSGKILGWIVFTSVAAALVVFVAMINSESIFARMEGLRELTLPNDGRFKHWSDTLVGLDDHFLFGTGLGSYRYAHRPYQSHEAPGWFFNADSEYVEWLLEGGVSGFAIVMLLTLGAAICVWRLLSSRFGPASWTEGVLLLGVLIVHAFHGVVDYAISMPANLLLTAVLVGSAVATSSVKSRVDAISRRPQPNLLRVGAVAVVVVSGLCCLSTGARLAAHRFQQSVPNLTSFHVETEPDVVACLADADRVRGLNPLDASIRRSIARLHLYRLRVEVARAIDPKFPSGDSQLDTDLWERTDPTNVFLSLAANRREATDTGRRELFRDQLPGPAKVELDYVIDNLKDSMQINPLLPDVNMLLACLDESNADEPTVDDRLSKLLGREALLSPADSKRLRRIGILLAHIDSRRDSASCFRQALKLTPSDAKAIVSIVTNLRVGGKAVFSPSDILDWVVPENSSVAAIELARLAPSVRKDALEKADRILSVSGDADNVALSEIAELRGDLGQSIALMLTAVDKEPLRLEWRIRLAELFEKNEDIDRAIEQVKSAINIEPKRNELRVRLERLSQKAALPDSDAS